MSPIDGDELQESQDHAPREGVFDAQLSFETPFVEAPTPIRTIIKRDGREVPFEKSKIADAIFKAVQATGGHDRDRAESLAAGVAIYLSKMLKGRAPTVDQTHDAVEKVLVEMGHAKTALAYARYRDRRTRIRRLRNGDTEAFLGELEEARHAGEADAAAGHRSLFVRTSDERLADWNRDKIVEALVRETGLDKASASLIAMEVEQQIHAADVKRLTTSLIRELVDGKLIEHGFEEHRRKHARLGVPLYDAEQIICAPNRDDSPSDHDPQATDLILGERVKREFGLAEVFSSAVAQAHLRGDIRLEHLGFIDRLHSTTHSLDYIKRYGVRRPRDRDAVRPARTVEGLLARTVEFGALLQRHFVERVSWDAINVFVAPFTQHLDSPMLKDLARSLAFWCAPRASVGGRRPPATELIVHWDLPPALRDVEAIGLGGDATGRPHADFLHAAQTFAWTLIDLYRDAESFDGPTVYPNVVVTITPTFFRSPGHTAFLMHTAEAAAHSGRVEFAFDRNPQDPDEPRPSWRSQGVTAHQVTLNLPRVAFRAGDEAGLTTALDRLMEVAVQAHVEKRAFLEKLLAQGETGPLGLLALPCEGRPYLDLARVRYLVGIIGLNECVQAILGKQLHETDQTLQLGLHITGHIRKLCDLWAERTGLRLVPGQAMSATTGCRLADLDLERFPDRANLVVKTNDRSQDLYYTPGTQLAFGAAMSPIERVRLEGRFHEQVEAGNSSIVHTSDVNASKESIADFVQKAFHRTQTRRIRFSS